MAFSGDTFTKLYAWLTDPQRNEKIFNSRLDDEFGGIATGLTTVQTNKAQGAGSSTDNAAARFDGATGKVLQDSALIIADTTGGLSRSGNGGIPVQGTNTNDNAAAGVVGEIIESLVPAGSAVSLTTATPANVTSISLTAGDWDVWANVGFNPSGNSQRILSTINTTSGTIPTVPNNGAYADSRSSFSASAGQVQATGMRRYSLAATTTVYLIAYTEFTTGTMAAYGYLGARRVR
jgi:hypothetical protein